MRPTVIYIPELRRSFGSISEAARAAGADPSNVGKVLRGSRRTAAGLHFEYRWAREEGRGEMIRELQDTIRKANDIIVRGKLRKRFGFSKEMQDIDMWRDFIGSTTKTFEAVNRKTGRPEKVRIEAIAAGTKNFQTYSVGEMELVKRKLEQRIFLAEKAEKKMDEDIKNLGSMLGLSFREALEYDNIFGEFYRMLHLGAQDQRVGSNEMLQIEINVTNAGASEDQVQDLFQKLDRFFADPSLPRAEFDRIIDNAYMELGIGDEFGNEDLF